MESQKAPRSVGLPILWLKAYENISECSRRPHIDGQGAKIMLCKTISDVMKDFEKFLCPKPFQGNFLLLQKNDREH